MNFDNISDLFVTLMSFIIDVLKKMGLNPPFEDVEPRA